ATPVTTALLPGTRTVATRQAGSHWGRPSPGPSQAGLGTCQRDALCQVLVTGAQPINSTDIDSPVPDALEIT
ncbi:unnamed protein product, partial [Gulo gulo]